VSQEIQVFLGRCSPWELQHLFVLAVVVQKLTAMHATRMRFVPDANWAGATPRTFWAAESRKSGVAPARFCFSPTVTLSLAPVVFLRFDETSVTFQVKRVSIRKVQDVILTFFTIHAYHDSAV
jgi:hypothetical protein